jgi:hypothetical protein
VLTCGAAIARAIPDTRVYLVNMLALAFLGADGSGERRLVAGERHDPPMWMPRSR